MNNNTGRKEGRKDVLKEKSFVFAVRIVKFASWLRTERNEYVLSKQILRSGTAVGALISEAAYGQSKADFAARMTIALKEANETIYWIKLLHASEIIDAQMAESLSADAEELLAMLISTVKTAKKVNND